MNWEAGKRWWHRISVSGRVTLLVLVVVIVGGRIALPHVVQRYVNQKLQQLPGYGGRVGEVDMHLWRGAYSIHDVNIVKKTNEVPIPFVAARTIDFSVDWRELRNRALVGEVTITDASLNFVKGERQEQDQTRIDRSWVDVVKDLFPFKINQFTITNSQVRYTDWGARPEVDISVSNLHVVCQNITNSRNLTNELPTPFELSGTTIGGGRLKVEGAANPFAKTPRFDVDAQLEGVDLTTLNDFLEAYANIDVKRGRLDFYTEMAAADGRFKGYAKPLLHDLDIINLKEDVKNPVKLAWKSLVAGVMKLFKNQPKDQFGAKVPLEGTIDGPDADILGTLTSVLRNAFVRALSAEVDESIDVESVKEHPGTRPPPQRDTTKNQESERERVREKQEGRK